MCTVETRALAESMKEFHQELAYIISAWSHGKKNDASFLKALELQIDKVVDDCAPPIKAA
jgi:hypothetical protein